MASTLTSAIAVGGLGLSADKVDASGQLPGLPRERGARTRLDPPRNWIGDRGELTELIKQHVVRCELRALERAWFHLRLRTPTTIQIHAD